MLRGEVKEFYIDEKKYQKYGAFIPLDGVDRYLIKIEMRASNPAEVILKRVGNLSLWAGCVLGLIYYYPVSAWWGYFIVIFLGFIIQFAVWVVLSFISAIFVNSAAKRAYRKYEPKDHSLMF